MSNRKKIGLLSLSNAENYGAVLQSYSLYSFCKKIKSNVEIINYFPRFMCGRYRLFWINYDSVDKFIKSCIYALKIVPFTSIKKKRFIDFRKKYLCNNILGRKRYLVDSYAGYIVGSDQIWNLELTDNDKTFFLDFVQSQKKKNSYAASIGVDRFDFENEKIFSEYVSKFNQISVREKAAVEYIKTLVSGSKCIYNNIDPVFLTKPDEWRRLESSIGIKNDYILVYMFKNLENTIKAANIIAQESGYEVIVIRCDKDRTYEGVRCCRCVGPQQFLALIDNAKLIITDSFHGTAFSMIFKKQFFTIPYNGTNSRIENILEMFEMSDRMKKSLDQITICDKIEYSNFDKKLACYVEQSRQFLEKVLQEEA